MEHSATYDSPLGVIRLTSDGTSLTELRFSDVTHQDARHHSFDNVIRWLDLYFSGANPDITFQLAPQGTSFQQRVWRELTTIPYGRTITYGDLAKRIGCRSAQAVGGAVGRNPIAIIIPCHRVVGTNGALTGYAYGIDLKRRLLDIEKSERN